MRSPTTFLPSLTTSSRLAPTASTKRIAKDRLVEAAGEGEAFYSLPEVHKRSGSKLPPHKFRHAVEQIVADAKLDPLPDYDLILEQGERSAILRMRHRTRPARLPPATPSSVAAS